MSLRGGEDPTARRSSLQLLEAAIQVVFFLSLEGLEGAMLMLNLLLSLVTRFFFLEILLRGRPKQLRKLLHVFPIVDVFVWQRSTIKCKLTGIFTPKLREYTM